ncbi:hypothetical protein [Pseudomarimonas salicorniae]|uniref:SPW repeat-containing protein n=1 Tax=Pseudomarimonas salicorniae TaxID=2933270 RepID=A0ABT0GLH7_9GAMM|nr:hypothetical protein [Lysobacter sp. CAU 1642]MCK7594885.1 hypothetical protein [Lysobacter sp. CAU 1642]
MDRPERMGWQKVPVLVLLGGAGVLASATVLTLQGLTFAGALLAIGPCLMVLGVSFFIDPRWSRGTGGLLLGLPIAINLAYQLYVGLGAPPGKWTALHMAWSSHLFGFGLAAWWLLLGVSRSLLAAWARRADDVSQVGG